MHWQAPAISRRLGWHREQSDAMETGIGSFPKWNNTAWRPAAILSPPCISRRRIGLTGQVPAIFVSGTALLIRASKIEEEHHG